MSKQATPEERLAALRGEIDRIDGELVLALAKRLFPHDRMTRAGRWDLQAAGALV